LSKKLKRSEINSEQILRFLNEISYHKKAIERYFLIVDYFNKTAPNSHIENRTLLAAASANNMYSYVMEIPEAVRFELVRTAYKTTLQICSTEQRSHREKKQIAQAQQVEKGKKICHIFLIIKR
jgi:hypothetical protein